MKTKEYLDLMIKMLENDMEEKRETIKYKLESIQDEVEKNIRNFDNEDRIDPEGEQLFLKSKKLTKETQELEALKSKISALKTVKRNMKLENE